MSRIVDYCGHFETAFSQNQYGLILPNYTYYRPLTKFRKGNVGIASHEVKLMFILSFVLIGMHSIYIWQLVWHVAAPLIMHMCGYIRGVATVWIYPYPAVIFSQVSVIMSMGGMVSLPP